MLGAEMELLVIFLTDIELKYMTRLLCKIMTGLSIDRKEKWKRRASLLKKELLRVL